MNADKLFAREIEKIRAEVARAIADRRCWNCGQLAAPRCHTSEGLAEFHISGMCEECFDAEFADEACQ